MRAAGYHRGRATRGARGVRVTGTSARAVVASAPARWPTSTSTRSRSAWPRRPTMRGTHWCYVRARHVCSSSWRPIAPAGLRRLLASTSPTAAAAPGVTRLHLEIADIREGARGCTTTRGRETKPSASSSPPCAIGAPTDTLAHTDRLDSCWSSAAAWPARRPPSSCPDGHRVELVERRRSWAAAPRASAPCFRPTTAASACRPPTPRRQRKASMQCRHRRPNLRVWRRTNVESVEGRRALRGRPQRLPNIVTDECINCCSCERSVPRPERRRQEGDLRRVLRRPRGAHRRPRHLPSAAPASSSARRGDRLQPVAHALHGEGRRRAHGGRCQRLRPS